MTRVAEAPEIRIFSMLAIDSKAARAFFALPHPPPENATTVKSNVAAAGAASFSAAAGAGAASFARAIPLRETTAHVRYVVNFITIED